MKSVIIGSSVEGISIEVQCRKYYQLLPLKDALLNRIVYPFKLSIFGRVTVLKPLEDGMLPINTNSLINIGDEIKGESIAGHCERALPKPEVKKGSGSHKASFIKTRGHSYARVDIGIREVLQAKEPV